VAVAVLAVALPEVDLVAEAVASAAVSAVEDSLAEEAAEVGSFLKKYIMFCRFDFVLGKNQYSEIKIKNPICFHKKPNMLLKPCYI
jgi:hypothetical protein